MIIDIIINIIIIISSIPFFFLQIYINILMLLLYITKESFSKFLVEFYLTFKLGKGKLYDYNEMTNFIYYFFVILFFGTFLGALFLVHKFIKKKIIKILLDIIGVIFALLILSLHVIINPIILISMIIINKCKFSDIKYDIKKFAKFSQDN